MANDFSREAAVLPRFFHRCFARDVRRFLVAAREELDWRRNRVDCTAMALLLVSLHGKANSALSNQLRQTKAMSPPYAIRWWARRRMSPPDIDPREFMKTRLQWRYAKGTPTVWDGRMYLGDSTRLLAKLNRDVRAGRLPKVDLLFTSPPYHGITNYHYDQWLRLWLLGYQANALRNGNGRGGRFEGREKYEELLESVFSSAAKLLRKNATIYVRTDFRSFTYQTTSAVLKRLFPHKKLRVHRRPLKGFSQTQLFGGTRQVKARRGEIDLVLTPK
jgi:hypothetical protein